MPTRDDVVERMSMPVANAPVQPKVNEAAFKGVFDISDADGVNDSERLLMRLCRRSFLSLWSFANLHTDQDMRDGCGSAKEFADVLVVFGNDIVIFSDKHVVFQRDKPLEVAWKRWYKRAVEESAKQLHGAMNWAKRFPARVFLDSACERRLPALIPEQKTLAITSWQSPEAASKRAQNISPEAWERCKSERTLSAQRTVTTRSPLEWFHLAKHLCMSSMSSLWSSSFAKWIPCRISFRILVPGTRMMAVLFENDCCMTETTLAKPELSSCDVCSARTKIAVQRCRVVPRVASTAGRGNLWAHSDGGFSSRSGSNGQNRPVGSSSTLTGPIVMDINLCRDKNE